MLLKKDPDPYLLGDLGKSLFWKLHGEINVITKAHNSSRFP